MLNWVQWLVRIFLILLILYHRKSEVRKSKNWLRCFSRTSRLEAKGESGWSKGKILGLHIKNIQLCSSFFEIKKGRQSKSSFRLTTSKSEFGVNQWNFDHNSTIVNCEYLGKCSFCYFLTSRDQFCAWQPTVCWLTFIASFPWLVK